MSKNRNTSRIEREAREARHGIQKAYHIYAKNCKGGQSMILDNVDDLIKSAKCEKGITSR